MTTIPLSENEHGRNIIIVLGVFLFLDYFFVFVRYWARYLKTRDFELNDWALLSSLVIVTCLYFVEVAAVHNGGVGLHVLEIITKWGGMDTIFTAGKLVLVSDILWNLSTLTIKISILHLYITIFGRASPQFRRTVWIMMGICIASTIIFVIQILVLCRPIAFFWDKSIEGGKCGSLNLTYLIPGVIITIEDIIIFTLPMRVLAKLKMPTNKKLGAGFIFGIGLGICLLSGVRLKYVIDLDTNDFTASITMFAIFGTLEPMLGIISACLPVVPALFAHYSNNRLMAWTQQGGSNTSGLKKSAYVLNSNIASHKGNEHADFERLSDGDYPLIHGAKSGLRVQSKAVDGEWSQSSTMEEGNAIRVTKHYIVDSHVQETQ